MLDGRFVGAQLLQLMLSEVADREAAAFVTRARVRAELACEQLHQRRLSCAVRSEQSQSCARAQREIHITQHDLLAIRSGDALQSKQRIRCALRLAKMKVERRI